MPSRPRRIVLLSAVALLALLAAIRHGPRPPLAASIPTSTAVLDRNGRLLRLTLAADGQYRLWTGLDAVSPALVEALLLHEDRHFFRHPGVNPVALARAALETYSGGARQGGSTLTMQLARLHFDLDTGGVPGKLRQIGVALWLELRYSKRELLEAHLNRLPYGGNVQGVGAASRLYFGKSPAELSLAEALTLVLIPQSPAARDPRGGESVGLAAARERLFETWLARHPEAVADAGLMRLPPRYAGRGRLPFEAPHTVAALLREAPGASKIHATLDLALQKALEREIAEHVRRGAEHGLRNAAALLIDYRSMEVLARAGSAAFWDTDIQGQVDGTRAKRSPGSALKPLLYALAIDQGLIHPKSVLRDAPTAFGPFSPENFDGAFVGPIDATQALVRSRNVPAVWLASRLHNPSFHGLLKLAGVSRLKSEAHYGLALALGGGEVTMEELVRLYAMLANRGVLRPLRERIADCTAAEPASGSLKRSAGERRCDGSLAEQRLLSEEASFMVLDMLRQKPRPDDLVLQGVGGGAGAGQAVAWKTGTSWGFRDAWTAGVFGPHVLAVWVGNFDGRGHPSLVGVETAAPLFFRIVDRVRALRPKAQEPVRSAPANLARIEVCAASGDLPNTDCPVRAETWFVPGKSPIRVSDVHRRVAVDTRSERQACAPFDPAFVREEVFEFWPSELLRLFAQAGMPRRRPPPPGDCASTVAGAAPRIVSPRSGVTYALSPRTGPLPLSAHAEADVGTLYWFVDDAYAGESRPAAALPWQPPRAGVFRLRVVDDHSRADERSLVVSPLS